MGQEGEMKNDREDFPAAGIKWLLFFSGSIIAECPHESKSCFSGAGFLYCGYFSGMVQ